MEKQRSVSFNFLMNFILTASSFLFPLLTFPYISRVLLPEGTGKVSFATSVVAYFVMVAMMGIPTYGIRACAKVRDDPVALSRTAQEIFILNLCVMAVVYVLFFVSVSVVGRLSQERELFWVMGASILLNVAGMNWLYSALEQYAYITVRALVFRVVSVILMFLLVREPSDYVLYGGISVLAVFGSSILNLFHVHKLVRVKPMGGYCFRRHWKSILVFFASAAAASIYTNLDNVMLGFLKGNTEVGYYNVAVNVKVILASLVTSLGTVLLPRLSYYVEKGRQSDFYRMVSRALHFVLLLSLPMLLFFMLFAEEGVEFLSGSSYAPAAAPLRLILITLLPIGLSNVLGVQVLVPTDRERLVLVSVLSGAALDLVLNFLLIPGMGASGAAIGTVAAEVCVLGIQAFFLRSMLPVLWKGLRSKAALLSVLPALAAAVCVKAFLTLPAFPKLLVGAAAFFGVYLAGLLLLREAMLWEGLQKWTAGRKKP